jgi:pimeloyl-ACP methyl ester carboxylesterase
MREAWRSIARIASRAVGLMLLLAAGCGGSDSTTEAWRGSGAGSAHAITVYLHHIGWGRYYWHFKAVPGYDYVTEMARKGHVSLVYDQLGYGASAKPPGSQSCYGSEADTLSQITSQLRSGGYTAGTPAASGGVTELPVVFRVVNRNRSRLPCPADGAEYDIHGQIVGPSAALTAAAKQFSRVSTASHVVAALMTGPEAYSFEDVDALLLTSWSSDFPSLSPTFGQAAIELNLFCAVGGEKSEGDSGPGGYHHTPLREDDFRFFYFFDADPAVIDAATTMRHRGPCGEPQSAAAGYITDQLLLRTITVPVLLVFGSRDRVFSDARSAGEKEAALFTGTNDVTLQFVDGTGSALALERSAPRFRDTVSEWLSEHGF